MICTLKNRWRIIEKSIKNFIPARLGWEWELVFEFELDGEDEREFSAFLASETQLNFRLSEKFGLDKDWVFKFWLEGEKVSSKCDWTRKRTLSDFGEKIHG